MTLLLILLAVFLSPSQQSQANIHYSFISKFQMFEVCCLKFGCNTLAFGYGYMKQRHTRHTHHTYTQQFYQKALSITKIKRTLVEGTSSNDRFEKKPVYEPDKLAVEFFRNPYFYKDRAPKIKRQERAEKFERARTDVFQCKCVKEIFGSLRSDYDVFGAFKGTGVDCLTVISFAKEARIFRTPEEILDGEILAVNESDEIRLVKDRHVRTTKFTVTTNNEYMENVAEAGICYVLGPSGSGKTFFAIKFASEFDIKDQKLVTVYINLEKHRVEDIEDLVKQIKTVLENKCLAEKAYNYDPIDTLNIRLSVILDNAGISDWKPYFESTSKIINLDQNLCELATEIRLVVCGSGFLPDIYMGFRPSIRMEPWSTYDLSRVNDSHFRLPEEVVKAIQQHPSLNALTTNARMAWVLLDRVRHLLHEEKRPSRAIQPTDVFMFQLKVNIYAPEIIKAVVTDYIDCNGLKSLNDEERRRIAAAVFDMIENTRKIEDVKIPLELPGLTVNEENVALSLVSVNVVHDSCYRPRLSRFNKPPFSVTPAIKIVLDWMCSVPIPVPGNSEEQE